MEQPSQETNPIHYRTDAMGWLGKEAKKFKLQAKTALCKSPIGDSHGLRHALVTHLHEQSDDKRNANVNIDTHDPPQ